MKEIESHWYEASIPSQPDSNGLSIVGYKWVEAHPGKRLQFIIIRQANGDFFVSCDQASLTAARLSYRPITIYAPQAQAMPDQVIWSIILEGVSSL
ncbi:hypothetical protein [Spirosoma litoris]